MQDLRITLIQTDLYWENTIANWRCWRKKIHTLEVDGFNRITDVQQRFSQNVKATAEPESHHAPLDGSKWRPKRMPLLREVLR
jgi:hypothetical protein